MTKVSVVVFIDGSAKAKVFGTAGVEYEESQRVLQFLHYEAKKQMVLRMNRDAMVSWQQTTLSVSLSLSVFDCLSVCLSFSRSMCVCLSVFVSVCLSVSRFLSVCLSVCLSLTLYQTFPTTG